MHKEKTHVIHFLYFPIFLLSAVFSSSLLCIFPLYPMFLISSKFQMSHPLGCHAWVLQLRPQSAVHCIGGGVLFNTHFRKTVLQISWQMCVDWRTFLPPSKCLLPIFFTTWPNLFDSLTKTWWPLDPFFLPPSQTFEFLNLHLKKDDNPKS